VSSLSPGARRPFTEMIANEDQIKEIIENLANTFGQSIRSRILRWPDGVIIANPPVVI
jgi:hypothetical protein